MIVTLQPLAHELDRLSLQVAEVDALREDGLSFPLAIRRREVASDLGPRETLLAAGQAPEGHYTGLSLRLASASLSTETGPLPLALPGEPSRVIVPFTLESGQSRVLSVRLHGKESMPQSGRLEPVLSAEVPAKPARGLIGLVSNRDAGAVTVIDKVSGSVSAVLLVGRGPCGIALDAERGRAFVALSEDDAVASIDVLEVRPIERLQLTGGDRPTELALTPDARMLLSANAGSSTVSLIDARALFETGRVQVGDGPSSVLIDRAGRRAYTFDTLSDSITVVDVAAGSVVGSIATESGPLRGQLNRAQDRLYVIHRSSPYLTVVDTAALSIIRRVYIGAGATAVKVDPRTDRLYLYRRGTNAVEVFDPLSFLPIESIPTPGDVAHITIDLEGNSLYLALSGSKSVRMVRLVGKSWVWESDMVGEPFWMTVMGER